MDDVFDVYTSLWEMAGALGAKVRYNGLRNDGEGTFHPDPFERGTPDPTISIGRPCYEEIGRPSRNRNPGGKHLPPPDLLQETVTLAHEFGHFLSWKDRTPREEWDAYFIAVKAQNQAWSSAPRCESVNEYNNNLRVAAQAALTKEQMQRIIAEEERAWTIARELLESVGFDDFAYYEERVRKGLHYHRYRLGIDDLWDDDLTAGS